MKKSKKSSVTAKEVAKAIVDNAAGVVELAIIRKLNSRLRSLRKTFGTDPGVYKLVVNSVSKIPGVHWTSEDKTAFSTVSMKTDIYLLKALEKNIPTVTDVLNEQFETDPYGLFRGLSKKEAKSYRPLAIRAANVNWAIGGTYADILAALYDIAPSLDAALYAKYDQLLSKLSHPGYRLSESEMQDNIDAIEIYFKAVYGV